MAVNPEHERRLQEARALVQRAPDDVSARLALATALVEAHDPAGALEQFGAVLSRDPANLQALQGAAQTAVAVGDVARASGYLRLLAALSGVSLDQPPPVAPTPLVDPFDLPGPPPTSPQSISRGERPTMDEWSATDERGGPSAVRAEGWPDDHDDAPEDVWRPERPSVTLADVAGMEAVKRRLNVAFLAPLRDPALGQMFGKSMRGGLLLFGPPGCGKTFVARATAGELGARFMSVGLADVLDMWLGQSERNLHAIFRSARQHAPVVLFFDEIDALGRKRSQLAQGAGRNVVNQLLAELDGVDTNNEGVFVLAATNHLWDVDTALLRPGRFDRMVLVLPPDRPAREAIIRHHLKGRPVDRVDVSQIAARTEHFSGADLTHLCESATELALEDSIARGAPRPIVSADFQQALRDVRPSTRSWFEAARNYAVFANESGIYDDLLAYLKTTRLL
jgi:SpoVK/Ycf46/Vps4 family AAA+-type ATPase